MARELIFKTEKQLKSAVDSYFDCCDEEGRPYTMSGLALHLGVCRNTILNYGKRGEKFSKVIERARNRVEAFNEEELHTNPRVAGIIFSLKNNFGWKDEPAQNGGEDEGGVVILPEIKEAE